MGHHWIFRYEFWKSLLNGIVGSLIFFICIIFTIIESIHITGCYNSSRQGYYRYTKYGRYHRNNAIMKSTSKNQEFSLNSWKCFYHGHQLSVWGNQLWLFNFYTMECIIIQGWVLDPQFRKGTPASPTYKNFSSRIINHFS